MIKFEPAIIPTPAFSIGQLVKVNRPVRWEQIRNPEAQGTFEGRITGMLYTSKDAALASRTSLGWTYTIEVPADTVLSHPVLEPHEMAWQEEMEEIPDRPITASAANLAIDLPESVPAPKFKLFDRVKVKSRNQKAVVTSMRYISLFTAVVNRFDGWGWNYEVDYHFGEPVEQALGLNDGESVEEVDENDLQAIEG